MEMIAMLGGLGQTSGRNVPSGDLMTDLDPQAAAAVERVRKEAQAQYVAFWKGAAVFAAGAVAGYFLGRASTRF